MNTRILVLSGALSAASVAACGASDQRPAQDPTTVSAQPVPGTPQAMPNDPAPATPAAGTAPATAPGAPIPAASGSDVAPATGNVPPAPVNVDPGASTHTANADNTAVNERDRHGALTPMNQGNSAAEIKITANIRKALMSDKSLSFTAKNVKVITVGSKVTLRGPVKSDQEKAAIENAARQATGVTEVDDQLEVKN